MTTRTPERTSADPSKGVARETVGDDCTQGDNAPNPLVVSALIALSKGATLRDVQEDSTGHQVSYPGAEDFGAAWDSALAMRDFESLREQFNDTIICRKYHEELPALERAPFPGAKGQDIFDNVSAKAWADWQKHQTLLINEKRLNMMNAEDRKYLQGEMDKFFSGEDYAKADGYVPPAQ